MAYTMDDFRREYLQEKQIIAEMTLVELWQLFTPKQRRSAVSKFTPEERLRGLSVEERLRGLTPEEIRRAWEALGHPPLQI